MRVLVCGGRHFGQERRESRMLFDTLDMLKIDRGISVIIHGAAPGADSLAGVWARRMMLPEEQYRAEWKRDGKAAGPIRNQRMIDEARPDLVVAFQGGRGTADMVQRARIAGIQILEVDPK